MSLPISFGVALGWPMGGGYSSPVVPDVPSLIDELGNPLTDELGNTLIGQSGDGSPTIREAAKARGLTTGIAYKSDNASNTVPYLNLVANGCNLLIPEVEAQMTVWCPTTRATFDFTRTQGFLNIAKSLGVPWKVPSGFIYPAHDCAWISTNDGTNIIPVLDANGQPNVRASTWKAIIDEGIAAFKAFCVANNSYPKQINASNELTDPNQADGWRVHPWYTATNGPGWLIYLIKALRAAFPGIPIGLCQDLMEQPQASGYGTRLRAAFISHLDILIAAGAAPDYVDFQCHLRDDRGFDALGLQSGMQQIRDKGIKMIIGELDCRAATPANYSVQGYYQMEALLVGTALGVMVPFLSGGFFGIWTYSDLVQGWGAGQLPDIYDSSLNVKPAYYAAVREQLVWS